jgi:hypothetical protein
MSEFAEDPEVYGTPLALFDGDPAVRPEMHIFVADKAPWHEITDDLPQFAGMPHSAVYDLFELDRFRASGVLLPLGGEDRC